MSLTSVASSFACRHESDVQQAASTGRWPSALLEHARECRTCADVRAITEAFTAPVAEAPMPRRTDPALLFARAREERRLHAEAQISRVATGTHVAVLLGVLAVTLYFAPMPEFDWAVLAADWPTLEFTGPADSWTWVYAAGAFLMASLVMFSRWASQDV